MKIPVKRFIEQFVELLIKTSGYTTSIIVLLIVVFLFKEGISFLGESPIEHSYTLISHEDNPVSELKDLEIKNVFDGKITNWKVMGGEDLPLSHFELSDLESIYGKEALGKDLEFTHRFAVKLLDSLPGALLFLPVSLLKDAKGFKTITAEKITLVHFLSGREWFPTSKPSAVFGALPLLLGTLVVSFFAILLALPFGLAGSIYLAEIADMRIRNILKPIIELLSGIPSVVYGFFGLVIIVPWLQEMLQLPVGETALAGSVVLAIMALPTIITVSEDAIRTTPRAMKEASLALGASHWQTIRKVILPYASSGITAAVILGIGRAIGETMAVLMVTGNAAMMPTSLTQPVRTIPATIAAELGEASFGGQHFKALFALGCMLFLITLATNFMVERVSSKRKLK